MLVTVTIDGEDKQTPTLSPQDMSRLTELVAKLVQEHLQAQASPSGSIDDDKVLALTANQTFDQEIRRIIQEHLPSIDLAGTLGLNPGNNSMSEHYQEQIQRLEKSNLFLRNLVREMVKSGRFGWKMRDDGSVYMPEIEATLSAETGEFDTPIPD